MTATDFTPRTSDIILSPEDFQQLGSDSIVYVRTVKAGDLKGEFPDQIQVPDTMDLYSVHTVDGTRVAVLDNRDAAFAAAKQYDMEAVSVH